MAGGGTGGRMVTVPIGPGNTERVTSRGTVAYFVVASAQVNMKADSNDYSLYYQGTGLNSVDPFDILTLQNPNDFPIAIALWVGFNSFIDRRLILNTFQQPNVVNPLITVPGSSGSLAIPDLSGNTFVDINGVTWIAVNRQQILISNVDTTNLILLQKFGNSTWNTGAIFAVQPLTEIGLNIQGNYQLVQNGGVLNCLVSESYSAIPLFP